MSYEIANTASRQRIDREGAVFSDTMDVNPQLLSYNTGDAPWVRWPGTPAHQLQLML